MSPLKTLTALAILIPTVLAGCDTLAPRVYEQRIMKVQHVPRSALDIVTANGSIRALQEDRQDVAIEVELFGRDAERLSFATVHADRQGD